MPSNGRMPLDACDLYDLFMQYCATAFPSGEALYSKMAAAVLAKGKRGYQLYSKHACSVYLELRAGSCCESL